MISKVSIATTAASDVSFPISMTSQVSYSTAVLYQLLDMPQQWPIKSATRQYRPLKVCYSTVEVSKDSFSTVWHLIYNRDFLRPAIPPKRFLMTNFSSRQ